MHGQNDPLILCRRNGRDSASLIDVVKLAVDRAGINNIGVIVVKSRTLVIKELFSTKNSETSTINAKKH
jgi:hypothetical protein